ncbi:hypothetical protein MMPV_004769 [Pyropia vietnamensis]
MLLFVSPVGSPCSRSCAALAGARLSGGRPRLRRPARVTITCDARESQTVPSFSSLDKYGGDKRASNPNVVPATSPFVDGIKSVAVGKYGTRPLPEELVPLLLASLKSVPGGADVVEPHPDYLRRAAFLGALFVKASILSHEAPLLAACAAPAWVAGPDRGPGTCTAGEVLAFACVGEATLPSDESAALRGSPLWAFALALLAGEPLDASAAERLGGLLYSTLSPAVQPYALPLKCLIAHVMRIRHESSAELIGLNRAITAQTVAPVLSGPSAATRRVIQLAEPFDGVRACGSELLTPLLADRLAARHDAAVVLGVGASGGPKYGPNLETVCAALGVPAVTDASLLPGTVSSLSQRDAAPGVAAWTPLRRAILKRPALATLEKYVGVMPQPAPDAPAPGAGVLFVGSAFHQSYVSKMQDVAEAAGYVGYVIVQRGAEGSIGAAISARAPAQVLVGRRCRSLSPSDGSPSLETTYEHRSFTVGLSSAGFDDFDIAALIATRERLAKTATSVDRNVALLRDWKQSLQRRAADVSDEQALFNARVRTTFVYLDAAVSWAYGATDEVLPLDAKL